MYQKDNNVVLLVAKKAEEAGEEKEAGQPVL